MAKGHESLLKSLGDSVDMLPGFSHQALLGSTALTEPIQVHGISHPLFGVDPFVVLISLFCCFSAVNSLHSKC